MRTLHAPHFLNQDLLNNQNGQDNAYVHHMSDVASHTHHVNQNDIALLVANSLSGSPAPPNDPSGPQDDLPRSHEPSRPSSTQPLSTATAQVVDDSPSLSSEGHHSVQQAQMAIQSILASVQSKENGQSPVWSMDRVSHAQSPDPTRSNGQVRVYASNSLYQPDALRFSFPTHASRVTGRVYFM